MATKASDSTLRRAESNRSGRTTARILRSNTQQVLHNLPKLNQEVWLVLSLILISMVLNLLVASNQMVLGFYTLPTVFSAYLYGRRHATLTALGSILLVVLVVYYNPAIIARAGYLSLQAERFLDITVWGGILILTAYAMGTLYEARQQQVVELRKTYNGVLVILQHFISNDKYTHNHSYRVSIYAARIAAQMGLDEDRIEDIRVAALLHDIGKLKISRDLLYKASKLSPEEFAQVRRHLQIGMDMLNPVGGSLQRVLPIILAHHDRFDGSGYHPKRGSQIPLEARILSLADVYDALTSDRPYRHAMSPFEAKSTIESQSGKDFDPQVVEAFLSLFQDGQMEVPNLFVDPEAEFGLLSPAQ